MKEKLKIYLDLFWTFFKIGLFTFGGGYVMLSIIEKEVTEKKQWITKEDMFNLLAIAESTPGPFAINAATFIGYKRAKTFGSFLATLGVVLPSFIIIVLISLFLNQFESNKYIQGFLRGIQAGVGVLIFKAAYRLSKPIEKNYLNIIIFFIALIVAFLTNFSLIYLMLILMAFGIALYYLGKAVNL
ncbi:MAG TPA: chromate transporter [Acholeplasmataceae bacterium]|jgi:chromate transporter|nr:chromate transporter [Acholeplasmataceae bacterium]